MTTSRLLEAAEIHGPYVGEKPFADAKDAVPIFGIGGTLKVSCHLFPKAARSPEHEFISATEIGRSRDIAVMAEIQRNVDIAVALSGSEVPRGIAIAKRMSR